MPAAAFFFQYPEFLVATLLGLMLLRVGPDMKQSWRLPQWLAGPARDCLLSFPESYVSWLTRMQIWAGWRNNSRVGDLASAKVYPSLLSVLCAAVVPLPAVPLLVGLVFFLPDLIVFFVARIRQRKILDSLPQALDLMVLCVDAGLALDATLQRIAGERTPIAGELNEELLSLGRDILLGMDREQAYQELYTRTGVEELKTLGSALNQGSKLGLSIGKILRTQSEFIRLRLGQKAEERALKLPIYMAFPLWFCIMPALLVIVLAPSLINFFQQVPLQAGFLH